MISIVLLALVAAALAQHDHDHDHDHGNSTGTPNCECVTGFDETELDVACEDEDQLNEIQAYLIENDCISYCEEQEIHFEDFDPEIPAWNCFQMFSLVGQYHDYCASGAINETLYHIYLDECPDCIGQTHYDEDAPDCVAVDCTDATAQLTAINYVVANCISSCDDPCEATWQEVEAYHQTCDHDDLSEQFDTIFDNLAYDETTCEEVHCNVVSNATTDCTAENNEYYYEHWEEYGDLDVDELLDDGAFQVVTLGSIASMFMMLWQ